MSQEFPPAEMDDLLEKLCEGELSTREATRLNELLRDAPKHRDYYRRYMSLHAALTWEKQGLEHTSQRASRRTSGHLVIARHLLAQPRVLSFAIAALVIGLLITAMAFMAAPIYRAISRDEAGPPTRDVVAQITGLHEAVWPAGQTGMRRGALLLKGQQMELQQGVVELIFDRGAVVLLEGPASFTLEDGSAAALHEGKLAARVNKKARGFTVHTSAATIVDVGTEFSVHCNAQGDTTVQVHQGQVRATPRSHAAGSPTEIKLTAGQSLLVAADYSWRKEPAISNLPTFQMLRSKIAHSRADSSGNLIVNGSFETAAVQRLESQYQQSELGTAQYVAHASLATANAPGWRASQRIWYLRNRTGDGDWAVRIDAALALGGVDVLAQPGLTLQAETRYVLSFDLYGETPQAGPLNVRLTDTSNATDHTAGTNVMELLSGKTTVGNDGQPERVQVEFTPDASATYTLQFFVLPEGGDNHVWIDDVCILPAGKTRTATNYTGGNDLGAAECWDNGLPGPEKDGLIDVDGTIVANFGGRGGAVFYQTSGDLDFGDSVFNMMSGTWHLSGGSITTSNQWTPNGNTFHVSGGTVNSTGPINGPINGALLTVSGTGVIDIAQFWGSAHGTIDFQSDWQGSFTVGNYTAAKWKALLTQGEGNLTATFNGNFIDGDTFARRFVVSADGKTLRAVELSESETSLLRLGRTRGQE